MSWRMKITSLETASCFHSYMEARRRISERTRTRGMWPIKGPGGKGKSRKPPAQSGSEEGACRRGIAKQNAPVDENESKPNTITASAATGFTEVSHQPLLRNVREPLPYMAMRECQRTRELCCATPLFASLSKSRKSKSILFFDLETAA